MVDTNLLRDVLSEVLNAKIMETLPKAIVACAPFQHNICHRQCELAAAPSSLHFHRSQPQLCGTSDSERIQFSPALLMESILYKCHKIHGQPGWQSSTA